MIDSFAHHNQAHASGQVALWGVFLTIVTIVGVAALIYSSRKDRS